VPVGVWESGLNRSKVGMWEWSVGMIGGSWNKQTRQSGGKEISDPWLLLGTLFFLFFSRSTIRRCGVVMTGLHPQTANPKPANRPRIDAPRDTIFNTIQTGGTRTGLGRVIQRTTNHEPRTTDHRSADPADPADQRVLSVPLSIVVIPTCLVLMKHNDNTTRGTVSCPPSLGSYIGSHPPET
jgi:hypothetical protein